MRVRSLTLLTCLTTLAATAQSGILAVVNQHDHTVVLVDLATKKSTAISVGINGHEIVASPDGRLLYVPIYSSVGVGKPGTDGHTIDIIDVASRKLAATIDLGAPVRPHRALFGPPTDTSGLLYVSAELQNSIDLLDPPTRKVVAQVPTGAPQSHMFAISPDARRIYTANVSSGSVSILDLPSRKLIKVLPLTKSVQRMAFSNDGRWAFTSDSGQPRLAVLDTRTEALSRWVPVTGRPYVTQPTPDGRYLLVSSFPEGYVPLTNDKGLLNVIDLQTMTVTRTIPLPSFATAFFLHNGLIYMSCPGNGDILVLDPKTFAVSTLLTLTPGVDGMAWVPTPH